MLHIDLIILSAQDNTPPIILTSSESLPTQIFKKSDLWTIALMRLLSAVLDMVVILQISWKYEVGLTST